MAKPPEPLPNGADVPTEKAPAAPALRESSPIVAYPATYPSSVDADEPDLAATLRRYLHIAFKHKWLISGATLLVVAVAGLVSLMQTPTYSATVRIQIDRESARVLEGASVTPTETGIDFLKTEYELLKSRAMAERVVSTLKLDSDTDFLNPSGFSLIGFIRGLLSSPPEADRSASSMRDNAVQIIADNVVVQPVPGSRLVDITYRNPSPVRSERIANAFADAYIASNLDKRFMANAYAKSFLEDQIKQLKLRLEDSEKTLLAFAEKERIVQVNEKASIAENNLAAANAAVGQLISERVKNEQLWKQVESSDGLSLPQILTNSVIDGLRARRNELSRDYEEKLETFKPEYPAMIQISNKINEIDRQLASEVQTIRASLKAAFESSLAQENEMKARIETLRTEVLDLQKRGIQYGILKREVETNQGLYNSLLQRFKEVDIAGGIGTNNVFIVDRAVKPLFPSEPKVFRNLLLALVLGLGSGFGLAYLMELLDDRIRRPEDLEQLSATPTLGIIPNADEPDFDLLEALQDPRSSLAEAYRSLATSLQFSTETGLPRSIAVTSAGPGEGKTSTAIALARHFANAGLRVLLIDADLRKPSVHAKLRRDNSIGLSNYLTGAASPPDVIQVTDHANLALVTSGPLPPNAADLLSGTRMYSLLSVGLEVFDLIVIDCPPMLGLADAQLLSSTAAATIVVVSSGEQRKGPLVASLRRLQQGRGNVVGLVLTKFDQRSSGYGYGYGYGYGHEQYSYGASARHEQLQHNGTSSRS